jgi:hypothetical protein
MDATWNFDRMLGDGELDSNFFVAESAGKHLQDLAFARR